ncbi:MAG: bifunctional riboflavin kinase/FAD synthetase [Chlorobi bacterium]|nr:MAG: bifunctional riboflavin kinase/FAD synthetase [Bacteroidota bacterium]KXK34362.1 MAG: riboflavin biosynthesis protein RibF [Chlorobi bacterium OLB6]MBE2265175.1 bifunctional riboflavin kinase/FAD synthetase [Flavobacteriales bacterium]MBL1160184.1 bifunctional riboflavin kinase/FAD synthetase [Chlorobiota bacterium]MBW7853322.1 bifunctional riboflavin kinase/FAD synthetase [Candidatus Kapabacteria bacterium]MCC6332218.1 bifunctional riboflavin kinase/FAD synthetase [Ignavibacteria bact
MNVVTLGTDMLPFNSNSAVTVGTFDGVHLGHQSIISRMHRWAADKNGRLVVVTFEPHPQIVLQKPGKAPVQLLTTLSERLRLLEQYQVHTVIVIPFSIQFAATPPMEFVQNVLVNGIGVSRMFVGHDHMFGKDRQGNEELLEKLGAELNFDVEPVPAFELDGVVVSSTKIRNALAQGNVTEAEIWLGRPYSLSGTVVHGDGRGSGIGFPTANIQVNHSNKLVPNSGVYAVTAQVDSMQFKAVANLGFRPTFGDNGHHAIEVHLLDITENLYDREITIQFLQRLRPEVKFDSVNSLVAQIQTDIKQTQTYFQTHNVRISL